MNPHALVFLTNRRALADGSASQPEYDWALKVDIYSPEHPELDAKSLKERLTKSFSDHEAAVNVTRWTGNLGRGSEGGDLRAEMPLGSSFFYSYARYVAATRNPQTLKFVEFLLKSGLADGWGVRAELAEALKPVPEP